MASYHHLVFAQSHNFAGNSAEVSRLEAPHLQAALKELRAASPFTRNEHLFCWEANPRPPPECRVSSLGIPTIIPIMKHGWFSCSTGCFGSLLWVACNHATCGGVPLKSNWHKRFCFFSLEATGGLGRGQSHLIRGRRRRRSSRKWKTSCAQADFLHATGSTGAMIFGRRFCRRFCSRQLSARHGMSHFGH